MIINMFGGPSTGKSTTAAGVFYFLKLAGINCEMAREYAKDVVWKDAPTILDDQNYIFAKQNNKLEYLSDKVDVIITDAPLLLSLIYGDREPDTFKDHVLATYNKYDNVNIMLERVKEFNPAGRLQTEEQAREIDGRCETLLFDTYQPFMRVLAGEDAAKEIAEFIIGRLNY